MIDHLRSLEQRIPRICVVATLEMEAQDQSSADKRAMG